MTKPRGRAMKFAKVLLIMTILIAHAVLAYAASPSVGNVTPSYGSSPVNTAVAFSAVYSDPDGWQNLESCMILINTQISGVNCFAGNYNQIR